MYVKRDPKDQLLTYKEVAAYLKVSKSTLMRMIRNPENVLTVTYLAERVTRIKMGDIIDWLFRQNQIYNKNIQGDNEKNQSQGSNP